MKDRKDKLSNFKNLRRRAEEQLKVQQMRTQELSPEEAARLIHELQVHQIELELQSEELRKAQVQLEESRNKYSDLYDFAPVGYLTLDKTGRVVEANLTAATILGIERSRLVGQYLPLFMPSKDRKAFRNLIDNLVDEHERRGEFHFKDGKGEVRVMLLDVLFILNAEGHELCRVSLTDISELKRVQEELRIHKEDLEDLVAERTSELLTMNQQLREANEALKTQAKILESMAEGVAVTDNRGHILYTNPAFDAMFGYKPGELLGRHSNILNQYPPEENRKVVKEILRRLNTTGLWSGKFHNRKRDGSSFFTEARISALEVNGKKLLVSVQEDITERKRTKEALVRAKEEWERTFDAVTDYIAILDKDHRITRMNRAMAELLGRSPEEVLGLPCYKVVHGLDEAPPYCPHARVVTTGRDQFEEVHEFGRIFAVNVSPLQSSEGELLGSVHVARDITNEKMAEEALRESEARYRSLVELSPDAVLVAIGGAYAYANQAAARLFGAAAPGEMLGQQVLDLVPPEDRDFVRAQIQRIYQGENVELHEGRILRLDGQPVDVEVTATTITYRGQPAGLMVLRDITERKQAEREIRRLASFPELNPNPVMEIDEHGAIGYANLAAQKLVVDLQLPEGLKALVPPDLENLFKEVRLGASRRHTFDLRLQNHTFAITLHFPHDLPTARLYALNITERKAAEQALRESRELLRLAQQAAGIGTFEWNIQTGVNTWTPELETIYGLPPGGFSRTQTAWENLVHPDDRAEAMHLVERAFNKSAPTEGEWRVVWPDGSVHWLAGRWQVFKDESGKPLRMTGVNFDITERKAAEQALRESREDLNRAQAVAHVGSWRMNVQRNELIWSDENHRIFGIPPGAPMTYETFLGKVHPEDREYVDRKWKAALEGEPYDIEHRIVVDGAVKWVRERAGLEFDQDGLVLGGFGTTQDITRRKEMEQALKEAHARTTAILDSISDCFFALDRDMVVTYYNWAAEKVLGRKADDVLGKKLFDAFPEARGSIFEETYREALDIGRALAFEAYFAMPPFENWYEVRVYPYGQGISVYFQVTTERKQAEKALQRAHDELEIRVQERTQELQQAYEHLSREMEEHQETADRLRESEARFAAFMHHLPGAAIMRDLQGRYVFANNTWQKLAGKDQSDWLGKTVDEVWPPEAASRFRDLHSQVHLTRQPLETIETMEEKDGTHYFLSNWFPIFDREGYPYLTGTIAVDITERKRAEEALKQNEVMLRLILDTLPVGVWVTDKEGQIIQSNPAALKIWGGARYVGVDEYGEYKGWWADTGQPIAAEEWALARAVQKGETSLGEVIDIECFDGTRKTIINSGVPLLGENQEILGAIVVNEDITAMRKAERVMREQARQLEAFFAHNLTPFVFLDPQFNFLRVNQAYARACEKEIAEFAGRNHFGLYHHAENEAIFRRVVETKTPYVAVAKAFEFPDHPEWGVTYWDWTLTPILNEAGKVDFLAFSLKDVTEQVRAEEEKANLLKILETTPDFVGIADADGSVTYINQAGRQMLGIGPEEHPSQISIADHHPPSDRALVVHEAFPTARREGMWRGETTLLTRDGRPIPVSQVILAHKHADGSVNFFSTVARDISDLQEAQDNLQRQGALLAGMNRILRETMMCETEKQLGNTCLAVAEDLSGSRFGFINLLNEEGNLDFLAINKSGWEACRQTGKKNGTLPTHVPVRGIYRSVIAEGASLIANDPPSHPDWRGFPKGHPVLSAFLGVPLKRGRQVMGLLGLGNREEGYSQRDLETVEALGMTIAEALLHKQAEKALKASEEHLHYLAGQLLEVQETERKRLSRELHDELGQSLLLLKLKLSSIQSGLSGTQPKVQEVCRETIQYVLELIDSVRRLSHDLSPAPLEDLGLTSALRHLLNEFCKHYKVSSHTIKIDNVDQLLESSSKINIYRIVQEALTNVGKHAAATKITMTVKKQTNRVLFTVRDNGRGFKVSQTLARLPGERGIGLASMQERLRMISGSLNIWSREGAGTKITFTVPIEQG